TIQAVRDGEHLDTTKTPAIPTVQRRPRLAGRVLARSFMWSLPLLVAAVTLFVWLSSGRTVTTDNAYVKGDRAQIATELSGIIVEVPVQENQRVSRGQLLFKLDDQSYRHALTRIDAEIETTRADIRGLRAQWRTKREEIKAALSQQTFAQAEFDRQSELAEKKVASTAKLEEARLGLDLARQRISAAQEDLQRIEAQLAGDPKIRADDHPRVRQMMAAREEALLQLRRTMIESPLDGIVAKRPVPGSYATAGAPVMVVVADTDLWIEANFKETELTRVRPGQKAAIHVDTYPDAQCTGTVQSISQATGAEFAVLPPQNASGNWVKVVQRIPVRVSVVCREGDPPLRVGMSTTVEIDTGHTRSFDGLLASVARSLGLSSASATSRP
ncbi:MAG: HlyD family secretion protein, partial [Reyranella sp.]|nr:HlyD family secretion protein [Reyranella sp.]